VLNVEPLGTRMYPTARHLDVRLEKQFKLLSSHEFAVRANVYNLTNENTILAVTTRSGTTFGKPTSIMPARLMEFSASYKF
jgi:hypothetical protein